jgi:spore coat protein CotH
MASRELKVMWGSTFVALALAASAFVFPNINTHQPPKKTPVPTKTVDPTVITDQKSIFDPSNISDIQLDIPDKSKKVLANANESQYVPASFQLTIGTKQTPKMDVAIKIKGTTSRYGINTTYQNTSFKVKFNFDKTHKKQTLLGLKSLTLNAMTQDSSKIHETYAYETYRAMGIPASRTGYAHLTMSKNIAKPDRGLYLVLESLDDVFLASNFKDITQHLYENNKNFTEITPANVGGNVEVNTHFKVKEGWKATPNRADLRTFAKGIQTNGKKLWDFLETNTDRDKLIMLFAVDNFTGGWDTYSGPLQNNFQIRSNQLGKMTFLPWGLDNTWGENYFNDTKSTNWVKGYEAPSKYHDDFFFPLDKPTAAFPGSFLIAASAGVKDSAKMTNYQLTRGALFRKCLIYKPCKTLYFQDLKQVSKWATDTNLTSQMKTTSTLIKPYSSNFDQAEQKRTIAWVVKQQTRIAQALGK